MTSLTVEQAKEKFCPLVNGNCKADGCHFFMWDAVKNTHQIDWPADLPKPQLVNRHSFLSEREMFEEFGKAVNKSVQELLGKQMKGGEVIGVKPIDQQLRKIEIKVELRETGDCCMRRSAEKTAP